LEHSRHKVVVVYGVRQIICYKEGKK
jgi:hypothetical protein